MPNRIIKDTIWTSPNFNNLSAQAERHFYRVLLAADDYGCFECTPEVVKGKCYPLKKISLRQIAKYQEELGSLGILGFWWDGERQFAKFLMFDKHNTKYSVTEDGKPTRHRRKTPEPPKKLLPTFASPEQTVSNPESLILNPESLITNPKDIYVHWNSLKIRVHKNLTPDMNQAIKKALDNYDADQIKKAMAVYDAVLKSKETYWGYKWGLIEFCQRGLKKFVDMTVEEGIANFKQKKTRGDLTDVSTEWKPGKGKM